ncbi:hypothetical protein ACE7GA_21360 [Roseomonas sp. CCTCC AB2023176]|uniref:hypothetical protein n=1 Tax=Roseomonas sp. CCTCC AB2023176 TaxID=3342640 RepID=UPI0035E0F60C
MKRRALAHAVQAKPTASPRIVLLDLARDPDGLPRPAVLFPHLRLPVVFPSIPAALAAINATEARA